MQDETPGLLRGSFVVRSILANAKRRKVSPDRAPVRIPCSGIYPVIGSLALMLRTGRSRPRNLTGSRRACGNASAFLAHLGMILRPTDTAWIVRCHR